MVLYTTGCSKCKILESKLADHAISYDVCEDKEVMKSKGFRDGTLLTYGKAVKYVNNWEDNQ